MVFRISKMSRRFISTIHMQLFLGLILFLFFLCQILFANLRLRDLWFTWKKLSKSSQVFEATIFILLVVTVKLLSLIQIFKNFSCCVILLQNVKSQKVLQLFVCFVAKKLRRERSSQQVAATIWPLTNRCYLLACFDRNFPNSKQQPYHLHHAGQTGQPVMSLLPAGFFVRILWISRAKYRTN